MFLLCAFIYRRLPSHQLTYGNSGWFEYAWSHLLASLVYANGLIFGTHPYPNVVLWSLEVEVQFYLLAPFLARGFMLATKWKRRTLLIGSILALSVSQTFVTVDNYRVGSSLLGNLQYFLVGFLLADLYLNHQLATLTPNFKWDAGVLFGYGLVFCFHGQPSLLVLLPWIIFACCLAAFRGRISSKILGNALIVTVGGMCYTIYLYHSPIISTVVRFTSGLKTNVLWFDLLVQFLLMTTIIVVICAVLFLLFERPFMRRDWPAKLQWRLFKT